MPKFVIHNYHTPKTEKMSCCSCILQVGEICKTVNDPNNPFDIPKGCIQYNVEWFDAGGTYATNVPNSEVINVPQGYRVFNFADARNSGLVQAMTKYPTTITVHQGGTAIVRYVLFNTP
jgi:hypothetical protein